MAIRLIEKYPTRAIASTPEYPGGSFKNETTPGAKDGTPVDLVWGNDQLGFFEKIILEAGITPSDVPDTALVSDYFNGMSKIFGQKKESVASMVADTHLVIGSLVRTLNYYVGVLGGGALYEVVAAGTGSADGGSFIDLTGSSLQAKLINEKTVVDVAQFGADSSGSTDASVAFTAADAFANSLGFRLYARGTFLLTSVWTPTCNNIDFRDALVQVGPAFSSSEAVILTGYANAKLYVVLNIDGDKATQTGDGVGVAIRDLSSSHTDIHINAFDCKSGVLVDGNSEKLNVHVGGFECATLVTQKLNTNTPDENNYWISGGLCDMWYLQDDNTSARVVFNVENNTGATDYAVKILGSKYTSLSGIIRSSHAGGVYLESDAVADDMVHFDGLSIYSVFNDYALYANGGRTLTGFVNIRTVDSGGVFIGEYTGGTNLNVVVDSLSGGHGLRLGDLAGGNPFRFGNINYTAYGNGGSDFGVNIDHCNGQVNLDMVNSDHTLVTNNISGKSDIKMSTRIIAGDVEISILDETPGIRFLGGIDRTSLPAYSYPAVGMWVDRLTDSGGFEAINQPAYYNDGNWSNAVYTAINTTTVLPTNGIIFLDDSGGNIAATLPDANILYQRVILWKPNAANTSTVTVTNHETSDPEVFTFADQYDKIILEWVSAEWRTVYNDGAAT